MSTRNDASQTLFRMVSLRNPQLTETKIKNLSFIQRPKVVKGVFDEVIMNCPQNTSKIKAIEDFIERKGLKFIPFNSEEELKNENYEQLLSIGRKITKREEITDQDWEKTDYYYKQMMDSNRGLTSEAISKLTILWDNLIYQIITQKNFYIKEALCDILKAIHTGFAQNMQIDEEFVKINGEDPAKNSLNGKIVIPKELFLHEETVKETNEETNDPRLSRVDQTQLRLYAQNNLTIQTAIYKREELKKLDLELKSVQQDYFKEREETYKRTYRNYAEQNQLKFQEQDLVSSEINKLINVKASEEELQPLYDKLKKIEIVPYEFEYKNEIDLAVFKTKLSSESFDTLIGSFTNSKPSVFLTQKTMLKPENVSSREIQLGENVIQLDDTLKTIEDILTKIQDKISNLDQIILDNTPLVQEQYINLEGATIPVHNNNNKIIPLGYHATVGSGDSGSFVSFLFDTYELDPMLVKAKIIADTDLGHFEEIYTNIQGKDQKIIFPPILVRKFQSVANFRVELIFSDNKEYYAQIDKLAFSDGKVGMLTPVHKENIRSKRNNFGIKRVGIADYLKVVQSVHAYVPGLVSNIENIMASELRHKSSVSRDYSEITDTTLKYQESEKLSDTSKTSRADMQTEIAKEIKKEQNITSNTRFSYNTGAYNFEMTGGYANNSAQQDSIRQAVMKSQEITEKAMEKVVSRVSEERVQKIIKEYTETNVHEFDNRGKVSEINNPKSIRPKHISGVYRWIDIKYKNQIYNYGKRTMFEFMVPEPARLHRLAFMVSKGQILTTPVDPRNATGELKMTTGKEATRKLLEYWAKIYKVELTPLKETDTQHYSFVEKFNNGGNCPVYQRNIKINDGYVAKSVKIDFTYWRKDSGSSSRINLDFSNGINKEFWFETISGTIVIDDLNLSDTFSLKNSGYNLGGIEYNMYFNLKINPNKLEAWQTENFNAIIKAYEEAYKKFQEEQAKLDEEQKKKEKNAKEQMSNFYRFMEQDVLKHNCIAYLLQDYIGTLGASFSIGDRMEDFQVLLDKDLDKYTALAKFMEQAFEWQIMDYTFYPYYWGKREKWQEMYISNSVDPLFRSFLQAGLARIIVTVKPGFEDAVQFFMTTGKIWNGGEVPVIGDPLYMSIADEMRAPVGEPQGKYWITKIPTVLTILQDKSTGLPVEQPLPIFPEAEPNKCENPGELERDSSFRLDNANLWRSENTESTLPKN
ncbi:hypothetical protein [Flavobacterium covae]|uniref:hypothetical protein n=1 Tax=Flavobacterium covae TaxID=2906076 RepID=UPI000F50F958|nr:hypothetical protein [Flavobacterium covae]